MKNPQSSQRGFRVSAVAVSLLATAFLFGCASTGVSKNADLAAAVRKAAPDCELHEIAFQQVNGENATASVTVSLPGKKAPEAVLVEMNSGNLTRDSQAKLLAFKNSGKKPEPRAVSRNDDEVLEKQLFRAVRAGNAKIVQALLDAGVNPNALETGRQTQLSPLSIAVTRNDLQTAGILLRNGADPNAELRFESVQFAGTVDQGAAIHLAACNGADAMIRLLARHGADLNAVCLSDSKHARSVNALGLAIRTKRYNAIRTLLANGANANAHCDYNLEDGKSDDALPLIKGADPANLIVNMLVNAGADVNICEELSKNAIPPLVRAIKTQNVELTEKMLRLGANPNFEHEVANLRLHNGKNFSGECTPIFYVGNAKIADALIKAGANVNYEISEGIFSPDYRALDVVIEPETRQVLLSAGARNGD